MQLVEYQIVLGTIATIVGVTGFIPYFKDIIKKAIKPHAFSWLIWGISQSTIFFAQTAKGGGAGAWANGFGGLLNLTVFVIAIFKGEKEITLLDKGCLVLALFGISLWFITSDPLWSVILLSGVDVIGYIPTMRKSYKKPHEESLTVFALSATSSVISLFALGSLSITTVLYPISIIVINTILVTLVILRRKIGRMQHLGKPT